MNACISRRRAILGLLLCGGLSARTQEAAPAGAAPTFKAGRPVITWIPPYATGNTKARLRDQPPDRDPASALTHLALQFWVPTAAGEVRRATYYDRLTDELIAEWRAWCHARGIRTLLCLYNGEEKWNWPVAQSAFTTHPEKFVNALLLELEFH